MNGQATNMTIYYMEFFYLLQWEILIFFS